ncbi:MAG TPA: hypothetical protein PKW87_07105 [Bacillota bacterium]|jgi:hypothetical protein|nr:hypothetical protein [Bacillota bacterium]
MAVLSPSGLQTADTGASNWITIFNNNWERLNDVLLKLSALQDVDILGLANGNVLRYNIGSGKWKPWKPQRQPLP